MAEDRSASVQRFGLPSERIGLWGWLGLYLSGIVLLVLLFAHLILVHYISPQPITFKNTLLALQSPLVRIIDVGLLLFAVFHGMLGLRKIILDLEWMKKKGARYLAWFLMAGGAALLYWGFLIFRRLIP